MFLDPEDRNTVKPTWALGVQGELPASFINGVPQTWALPVRAGASSRMHHALYVLSHRFSKSKGKHVTGRGNHKFTAAHSNARRWKELRESTPCDQSSNSGHSERQRCGARWVINPERGTHVLTAPALCSAGGLCISYRSHH